MANIDALIRWIAILQLLRDEGKNVEETLAIAEEELWETVEEEIGRLQKLKKERDDAGKVC